METQQQDIEQLKDFFSDSEVITLESGREVTVYKIKMKQSGYVLDFLTKVVDWLGIESDGTVRFSYGDPVQIMKLISKFPEEINTLLSMLTSLNKDQVDDLDISDGLALVTRVFMVNKSFFTTKVMPKVREIIKYVSKNR